MRSDFKTPFPFLVSELYSKSNPCLHLLLFHLVTIVGLLYSHISVYIPWFLHYNWQVVLVCFPLCTFLKKSYFFKAFGGVLIIQHIMTFLMSDIKWGERDVFRMKKQELFLGYECFNKISPTSFPISSQFSLSNDMDIKALLDVAILREYFHCEIGMAWSNAFISLSNLINWKGIKEIVLGTLREETLLSWFSFFLFPQCSPSGHGTATGVGLWTVRKVTVLIQRHASGRCSERAQGFPTGKQSSHSVARKLGPGISYC